MADDLTQKLGFDASDAITELKRLSTALAAGGSALQQFATASTAIEKTAPGVISAWDQMINRAQTLEIAALNARKAMGNLGTAGVGAAQKLAGAGAGVDSLQEMVGRTEQLKVSALATAKANANLGMSMGVGCPEGKKKLEEIAQAHKQVEESAKKTGRAAVVSWQTIARVIQAQIIVRVLSGIVQAFGDAQRAAREFSLAIGEISTISGKALGGTKQIGAAVLELSRNLGLAPTEVAEGLYQTISNQVVAVGDSLQFENEAAKLSIATHAELAQSVDALSSIMSAYNLDVSQTAHVSDVLFSSVNYGRFRLEEIADTLGRLAPDARATGIAFEEFMAALAAMTQQGVGADTAITQLHQVIVKLLKPSKELQDVYNQWGTKTGPASIARFGGLIPVLQKLQEASGGNIEVMARYAGRERSLTGMMNLLADGSKRVLDVQTALGTEVGVTEEAFAKMESTIGRQSTKAINDFKVSLVELGETLLKGTTPIIQGASIAMRHWESGLVSISAAVATFTGLTLAFKVSTAAATLGVTKFTAALKMLGAFLATNPVGLAAVAIGVVALAVTEYAKMVEQRTSQMIDRIKADETRLTQAIGQETTRRDLKRKKALDELTKGMQEGMQVLADLYLSDQEAARTSSKAVDEALTDSLADIFKKKHAIVKKIKEAALDADAAIKASLGYQRSAERGKADVTFQQETKNRSIRHQWFAADKRALDDLSRARQLFATAGADEERQRAAREAGDQAVASAKESESFAKQMNNATAERQAEQRLVEVYDAQIAGEKRFQNLRGDMITRTSKKEAAAADQSISKQEAYFKKYITLQKEYTDAGQKKTKEKLAADQKEAEMTLGLLFAEMSKEQRGAVDLYKLWGITELMKKLNDGVGSAISTAKIDKKTLTDSLAAAIASRRYPIQVETMVTDYGMKKDLEAKYGATDATQNPRERLEQFRSLQEGYIKASDDAALAITSNAQKQAGALNSATLALNALKSYVPTGKVRAEQLDRLGERDLLKHLEQQKRLLTSVTTERRALTKEEQKSLAFNRREAQELMQSGKLEPNAIKAATVAQDQLNKYHEAYLSKLKAEQYLTLTSPANTFIGLSQQIDKATASVNKFAPTLNKAGTGAATLRTMLLANFATLKQAADQQRGLSDEELQSAVSTISFYKSLLATGQLTVDQQAIAKAKITELATGVDQLTEAKRASENQPLTGTQKATEAKTILQQMSIEVQKLVPASTSAGTAMTTAFTGAGRSVDNATQSVRTLISTMVQGLTQLQGAAPRTAALGGLMYRAQGGISRGTDTIPAMLTPGEYVVNAKSARKFYSQLTSINAGHSPAYHADGGTTVGDVHINVTETKSSQQTAREVMHAFKRELRRNTSRL